MHRKWKSRMLISRWYNTPVRVVVDIDFTCIICEENAFTREIRSFVDFLNATLKFFICILLFLATVFSVRIGNRFLCLCTFCTLLSYRGIPCLVNNRATRSLNVIRSLINGVDYLVLEFFGTSYDIFMSPRNRWFPSKLLVSFFQNSRKNFASVYLYIRLCTHMYKLSNIF